MKRIYLLLAIFFLAGIANAINVEIDGIEYNINLKTGVTEVTSNGYHPYTGDIVIPEVITYDGKEYTVTGIGESAFFCRKEITSITFPQSITSIGKSAFWGCHGLDTIALPEKLTVINANLFADCEGLKRVIIPEGVTGIGNSAFNACMSMDSIYIPHSVTSIEDWAFAGCDNLRFVEMPRGLTYVGRGAFGDCGALKSVRITDLSSWAMVNFADGKANPLSITTKLMINDEEVTDLVIPDDVKYIGNCAFAGCYNITSVTIGDSVSSIGSSAFYRCLNCTSITIGENVSSIGGGAFNSCSAVTSVTSLPRRVPNTGKDAFDSYIMEKAILYVPNCAIEAYRKETPWKDFWDIVALDIPKHQLSYYVDDALYKSYTLEEGEFITPEPAPEKDGYTFSGWSEIPERMPKYDVTVTGEFTLTSKQLVLDGIHYMLWVKDETAEVVGFDVTDDFTGRVSVPSTVTKDGVSFDVTCIGDSAFSKCAGVTSVTIPESVEAVGEFAFNGCMLEHIFVKNTGTSLDENSFSPASYNHAMLYIPEGEWAEAVYNGDLWRFINIRETVTDSGDLSSKQAYTLMGANTFRYIVYDAINDTTDIRDSYYQVDENSRNNCWQIVSVDGKNYLYNIGAKKFAQPNTDGSLYLTETPVAINMVNSKSGIVFSEGGQTQWAFVLNDKVNVEDITVGIESVTDSFSSAYSNYYSIDGIRTDNPRKGLYIVRTKDGRTRKIVK